jgi:hypothetical protein
LEERSLRATHFESNISHWQALTEDYSKCSLSYDSDKLAAISGLAERLGKRSKRRYFAGIFEDPKGEGLMWRSYSDEPMTHLALFHAPSWTWAAYKGAIAYDIGGGMEMGESTCEISKLNFNINNSCTKDCTNKLRTCVTGRVSWIGMIGTAIRSGTIRSLNLSKDKDLINILGSNVHFEPRPTLRIVQGRPEETARKLSLPDRAEVMRNKRGSVVGWVLFDTDEAFNIEVPFHCAVMRRWRRVGQRTASLGTIPGYDYMGEEYMDVLALKERNDKPWTYERIGVGRIVDKGWIQYCVRKTIEIW